MNLKKRVMNRLEGKEVDITPVGCTTTYGVVDIMKAVGHERPLADTDPKAMAGLALGYVNAGFEWCKAMGWDITAVSEVMGCTLGEPKIDLQKYIAAHPFAESLEGLEYPDHLFEKGRFPAYKEQFKLLKDQLEDDVAVFGQTEGAWTAACNLVGLEQFMMWTLEEPDKVRQILEVCKAVIIDVVNWAFDQGADYYLLSEPSSSPELISPKMWQQYVQPMITEVCRKAKGPIVLHICGNTDMIIPLMCETGLAGISIEDQADLKAAVEIAHRKGVRVFGNVATATSLFMGSAEECYQEAIACLANGTDFLTPGCGIAPDSPLVNVRQLRKARDDFFKVG